jgi:hypothetical protein
MNQLKSKNREQLKNNLAEAFDGNLDTLSSEMQGILLDDLVTAFENRLKVLRQIQLGLYCLPNIEVNVDNETSDLKM